MALGKKLLAFLTSTIGGLCMISSLLFMHVLNDVFYRHVSTCPFVDTC